MPLNPDVLAKLRCPVSHQKLVPSPGGFTSEDGRYFYPIEEGFPVLTADAAIDTTGASIPWDDTYRSGETPWDKGEPAPPLTSYLESDGASISGRVFVPGCGRGHDARALAEHGAEVTALDISPAAIAKAKERAASERTPEIDFIVGDLFNLPADLVGGFDWVVEHTCLSGLAPNLRPAYFKAITSALKPDGKLFAIWFVNPDMDPGESGPPFGISQSEVGEFTASEFSLLDEWTPQNSFEGRENRELVQVLQRK